MVDDEDSSYAVDIKKRTSSLRDENPLSFFSQLKKTALTGSGFLADAYDLFVINIVVDIMDEVEYKQASSDNTKSLVKSMALVGAIVGQLGFGFFADQIGRKKIFIITAACIIVGALLSATSVDSSTVGIYTQLMLYRFLLGFGVGGEYPLSATITSESSTGARRGKNLAAVFSMQGVGTLLCAIVLVTVTHTIPSKDAQWRVALAFGALPMIITFYFRWIMHETSAWEHNAHTHIPARERLATVWNSIYSHGWLLTGTAGSWFILDIVFYANGLFSGDVTQAIGAADNPKGESIQALIVQSMSLPGYFCTILFLEYIGRKRLQIGGFIATGSIFLLMTLLQSYLKQVGILYVLVYGLTFFTENFGPNATTYIIPSEVFPTESRATCHGISAAFGKAGAALGALMFLPLSNMFCPGNNCDNDDATDTQIDHGLQLTFLVCSILSFIGAVWTVVFVNDKPDASLTDSLDDKSDNTEALLNNVDSDYRDVFQLGHYCIFI